LRNIIFKPNLIALFQQNVFVEKDMFACIPIQHTYIYVRAL
jgi:hypothetical protein